MKKLTFLAAVVFAVAFVSCKKNDSTTPSASTTNNNSGPVTINSTPQFSGTINSVNYSFVNGASGYANGTAANKQIGGSMATQNYGEYQTYITNGSNQPFFGIYKGTLTFPLSSNFPDSASFDAFFPISTCSYSLNYSNGIEVEWIDGSGNFYSTSQGSGSQSGSTFKITAKQAGMIGGNYMVKIIATFNCTLYSSSGSPIALTNGTYVGYFEND